MLLLACNQTSPAELQPSNHVSFLAQHNMSVLNIIHDQYECWEM